jgi:uncharacterized membrane protein
MAEPIFLMAAILLGPFAGAFVGGVGYALADLLLGYPHYIVAALTIKAAVGFIVGKVCTIKSPLNKTLSLTLSLMFFIFFGFAGGMLYSGIAYLGYARALFLGESIMERGGLDVWSLYIPAWFWAVVSVILIFYALRLEFKQKRTYGWTSFSLLSGTLITIVGYFLYETFMLPYFFNVQVNSLANVPLNFGQIVLSATISVLLAEIVNLGKFRIEHFKIK